MSTKDRRLFSLRPSSAPPESTAQVDASWDDATVPGLDLDDPLNEFDRVTAIPELPPELYAQRVMEAAKDSRIPTKTAPVPDPPPPPALLPALPFPPPPPSPTPV